MTERKKFSGKRPGKSEDGRKKFSDDKSSKKRFSKDDEGKRPSGKRAFDDTDGKEKRGSRTGTDRKSTGGKREWKPAYTKKNPSFQRARPDDGTTRLNKYLSNSGISSRREADELIKSGMVEVNGKIVVEMGYRVQRGDEVKYAGEKLTMEKPVYFLLNKPKDYSSSMKPSTTQKTVMMLLKGIGNHRVAPIGKLEHNTTGLMMFTNDGELSKKLSLQKSNAQKIYHIHLDKNMKQAHIEAIMEGVELESGMVKAEAVSYVGDAKDKKQVGIELRGGKDGVIRLLMDHLGYRIQKLDRVVFAGLTKKDLPRGKWRAITEKELVSLKMLK